MLEMWAANPVAAITAAGIIVLSLLAYCLYSLLSTPRSIFQKPPRYEEIKTFRKPK